MDSNQIIAEMTLILPHPLNEIECNSLINDVMKVSGLESISISNRGNVALASAVWEQGVDVVSVIGQLKNLRNIENVQYKTHKRIIRNIIENAEISRDLNRVKKEVKNSDQIGIEKSIDGDDLKVVSTKGGAISITGNTITINDSKVSVGSVNIGRIDPSEFLILKRTLIEELNKISPTSKEKTKLWYIQIGSRLTILILKLIDWISRHID
jgi:hypothetical protein